MIETRSFVVNDLTDTHDTENNSHQIGHRTRRLSQNSYKGI